MEAGMFDESFEDKELYDDNMTYEIIDAACDVLGKGPSTKYD